ncbi:CoA-binding protein [Haloferax sp. MBLA0076]|uniref:CoA-binding protein n=1 Tax=Haloferax litoreum TaxID=2666140 RepID=A0A6A8GKC6_9EURY|nr:MULTISPECIES: CoA-binding protein [Haloferax]KAB1194340.1 CoA-binding protein [Haloferax sp. CBA1148]MRX22902.1 CoA-binding protein [Haloferax litoreum]
MPITSADDLRPLLDYETIAVVGCSATPGKAAHEIPAYMQRHGYRVIPVNPFRDEILGETAYDSLADVDEDIDLVNVFRPSGEAGAVVDAAIERAAERGDVKAVWLQLGIRDADAAARAEDAGLEFVQNKCYKVEHARLAV